jgi:hypothetical protein
MDDILHRSGCGNPAALNPNRPVTNSSNVRHLPRIDRPVPDPSSSDFLDVEYRQLSE